MAGMDFDTALSGLARTRGRSHKCTPARPWRTHGEASSMLTCLWRLILDFDLWPAAREPNETDCKFRWLVEPV